MAEELEELTARLEMDQKEDTQDEPVCGICLENVTQLNDVRRLECDHIFCMNCLKKLTKHDETPKCALCGEGFDSDLESLRIEHFIDDPTQLDDKSVYSIQTHRCPVHTREMTTMGCKNCLSVFCCECLNECMLCPYYEEEGFHKLCSFSSLPEHFNDKMDEQKMLLHRMKFKLEDCDKQLLYTCDNMEDTGRDVYDQISKDVLGNEGEAKEIEDYLIAIRSKRDECSRVIENQITALETLIKVKESSISEIKPGDFRIEAEIFTKEAEKILETVLPEFKTDVITLSEDAVTGFKLQHEDFKLKYEFEKLSQVKPKSTPECPSLFQITNFYVHDEGYLAKQGPKHPEYYQIVAYDIASTTKLVKPWFIETYGKRLMFAYPIVSFEEDVNFIFVFTRHTISNRHCWPVRTLFRWDKVLEKMSIVFRTTQAVDGMTLSDDYVHFDGDYGRKWKVRKSFESPYRYEVLTENPRSNSNHGIYPD